MIIEKIKENDIVTFKIDGKLDVVTATKLQEELIPSINEAKTIVLDCEKLYYVSSAGLRVLLIAQKTANSKNVTLSLCNVGDCIMEVLEMTGFTTILSIV